MPDTVISVGGDIRDVNKKLADVENNVGGLGDRLRKKGASLGDVFGSLTAPLAGVVSVGVIKGVVDEYDRLGDLAARLGVTGESLQRVGNQAKLSGTDVETVVSALGKLRKNLEAGGNEKTTKALAELGLSAAQLLALEPDQQILALADGFQRAQQNGTGFVAMQDLMGKGFQELIPLLRTSRAELKEMSETPVVSEAQLARIQEFNDRIDAFARDTKVGALNVIDELGTAFGSMFVSLTQGPLAAVEFGKLSAQNAKDFAEAKKKESEQNRQSAKTAAEVAERQERSTAASKIQAENEKKKADIAFESLTTAEKLAQVYDRIADVNTRTEGLRSKDDPVAAARLEGELVDLMVLEADLKEKAANEREREAEAAKRAADQAQREAKALKDKLDAQMDAKRDLGAELAILEARARGREKLAQQLEKEQRIKAESKRIEEQTGLAPQVARKIAEQKEQLAERADKRAAGKIFGGVSKPVKSSLDDFLARQNQTITANTSSLDAFKRRNARDAAGNLIVPLGKGAGEELVRQGQEAQDQRNKVADPTSILRDTLAEIKELRKQLKLAQ